MTQQALFPPDEGRGLEVAAAEVLECRRCDLWKSGTRAVFGSGNRRARLMVVGEGPSEADSYSGKPFSGPSGELLDEWLFALALKRDQIWLTNVVKHRPIVVERGREKNRPPRAGEASACRVWLDLELGAVRPAVVLALGGSAGKALIGNELKISEQRGQVLPGPAGTRVLPTYHPAYLLRLESPELERAQELVAQDLATVLRLLQE